MVQRPHKFEALGNGTRLADGNHLSWIEALGKASASELARNGRARLLPCLFRWSDGFGARLCKNAKAQIFMGRVTIPGIEKIA